MKKYYFVSWNHGNGIYCTNLATAESAEDVRAAYAEREEVTVREADSYEIESAKRRGMPVTDCPHTEPEQPTEAAEEQPEEPAEQATPDGVTYHISENSEYNSREVYFSGKPSAETREALKALKMRWHGVKKCWYGYAAEHEIIAAIQGAELTANPEQGATVTTDGYMGGGAYYGAKSGQYLYGAELAAAIRADIKAAGIKGVTIRCKTYSGGQSITATVTIERSDLVQGYRIEDSDLLHALNYHGAFDGERWVYYSKDLDDPAAWEDLAAKVSAYEINKYSKAQSINHYHTEEYHEIGAAFIAKLQKIRDIITAYRYDESNSMVDYFDTNFYYDIDTKPGKSWTAQQDTTDIGRAERGEAMTA